jgi:hypothetical protein
MSNTFASMVFEQLQYYNRHEEEKEEKEKEKEKKTKEEEQTKGGYTNPCLSDNKYSKRLH